MEATFKRCFKCGLLLPLSCFYTHKQMGDGHLNKCKGCTRKDVHEKYMDNIQDPEYIEKERARGRNKYKRLYSGIKVKNKYGTSCVRAFIKRRIGDIDKNIELHHWNYNHPYSVISLDRSTHARLHKLIRLDDNDRIFVVRNNGERLDSIEKHCEFITKNFGTKITKYEF